MIKKSSKQDNPKPVGALGIAILTILNDLGTATIGGIIWKKLDESQGRKHHLGSFYPTLMKLRANGLLIESRTVRGRPTTTYQITTLGRQTLQEYRSPADIVFDGESLDGIKQFFTSIWWSKVSPIGNNRSFAA